MGRNHELYFKHTHNNLLQETLVCLNSQDQRQEQRDMAPPHLFKRSSLFRQEYRVLGFMVKSSTLKKKRTKPIGFNFENVTYFWRKRLTTSK